MEPLYIAGGNVQGTAAGENSFMVSQKTKYRIQQFHSHI